MPYSLVFKYHNGDVKELKPIAPDSMGSPYGYEDRRIKRKAENVARWINKIDTECKVEVIHYEK